MSETVLEFFVKKNMPNVTDYSKVTNELIEKGLIEETDRVIYFIPSSSMMNNGIVYSLEKLIVVDRGTGSGNLVFDYDDLISFKIVQNKLFFKKLDLSVTPNYDKDWGGGGTAFYVNKNYAEEFKAMHCNILTMKNPSIFDENTDWDEVMARR